MKPSQNKSEPLKIVTLGRFEVSRGEQIYSAENNRSYRMWELFKYLITYRNKTAILPEVMVDSLWPDQEYSDSKHALRTLIYRLRSLLEDKSLSAEAGSCIKFSQGGYGWNNDCDFHLDAAEFERLSREAHLEIPHDPTAAINKYRKAIELYQGDYLAECLYQEWVIPPRNYYQKIYLQNVRELIELLKQDKLFSEIEALCDKALGIDYYDEDIHIFLLEALLKQGKVRPARSHYENATRNFYKEMGIKPSPEMQTIARLLEGNVNQVELKLSTIEDSLKDQEADEGAFLCDVSMFNYLYKLESRRAERYGQNSFLVAVTLLDLKYDDSQNERMIEVWEYLQELLVTKLRRGDIITCWNDKQYLVILTNLNDEQARNVLKRVESSFKSRADLTEDIALRLEMKPITGNKEMLP